jgi:hypothetical protein
VFTNAANDFALTGTTAIGSTITLFNGSTQINPTSGPTVDVAGGWEATITALPESINSLTAKATKAGSNENTSPAFSLNVDRVAPAISGTPLGNLTVYLGNIGANNDSIPTATDFSSATVTSDWSTQVNAAEGAKTVTYTATDAAGNIATTTRTVNVSTEVIIPTITNVVDNGNGTATITGTVTGTYADNLTVQIVVNDSNNGSPFDVTGETFTAIITLVDGTYQIQAKTVNTASDNSEMTGAQTLVMAEVDVTAPIITITNNNGGADITNTSVTTTVGGGFAFTAITDDGSLIIQGGDTLDINAIATYSLTFSSTDGAGNVGTATLEVVVEAVVGPFIENSSDFTLFGNSTLDNVGGNLIYNHGIIGTGNHATGKWSDGLTHDGSGFNYTSYTLSFWVKFNSLPANNDDVFIFSARDASHNGLEFIMDTAGDGSKTLQVYHSDAPTNNATRSLTNIYTSGNAATAFQNVWINFVAVVSNNDENLNVYINESLRRNGQSTGYSDTRLNGVKYVNDITNVNSIFTIGDRWDGSNDHIIDIEIDSIQIAENVILTEAQANAIAGQLDRQMTIETAASLHFSSHLEEQGTLSGTASLVAGVLVAPGLGDYTSLPMTPAFKSNDNQTISFWFKTTYTPANNTWMRFIHSQVNGQTPNGFFIEMRSPTKIYFKGASQALVANDNPAAIAPYALNDGVWHQITLSWQDLNGVESLRIWVDGVPMTVLDETLVGSGNDNKSTLFIGARQFNSPMEMDKVGITEEFIDDAEALARYNSEVP